MKQIQFRAERTDGGGVAKLSRKQRREKYSDEMCREIRYQISNNFFDERILYKILTKWMKVATKTKYIRPSTPQPSKS